MRWIFFTLLIGNLALAAWQLLKWQGFIAPSQSAAPLLSYRPTPGAAPIVLVSEAPPSAEPASVAPPASAEVPSTPASPSPPPLDDRALCLMIGPYEKSEDAAAAIQRLAAVDIASHINEIEINITSSFQVYLDPLDNRAAARVKLEQLQAMGIDSFIIPKGELINGIALGSFDNEPSAKEHRDKLLQKGIDAKVRDSKRPLKETWVALAPGGSEKLGAELKSSLLRGKSLEERQILCTAIARP